MIMMLLYDNDKQGLEIYQMEATEIFEFRNVFQIYFKPQISGDFRGKVEVVLFV